jgi:hypothetical protein
MMHPASRKGKLGIHSKHVLKIVDPEYRIRRQKDVKIAIDLDTNKPVNSQRRPSPGEIYSLSTEETVL